MNSVQLMRVNREKQAVEVPVAGAVLVITPSDLCIASWNPSSSVTPGVGVTFPVSR